MLNLPEKKPYKIIATDWGSGYDVTVESEMQEDGSLKIIRTETNKTPIKQIEENK